MNHQLAQLLGNFLEEQANLIRDQAKRFREACNSPENIVMNEKKTKKKRERLPVDPNKPKQPLSGYLLYQNQFYDIVKEQNKDLPHREILVTLAERWKNAPDKDYYLELAKQKRKAYQEDLLKYQKDLEETNESSSASRPGLASNVDSESKLDAVVGKSNGDKNYIADVSSSSMLSQKVQDPHALTNPSKSQLAIEDDESDKQLVDEDKKKKKKHRNSESGDLEGEKKKKKKHKHKYDVENDE